MGVVEETYLKTVEANIKRLKDLRYMADELSSAISEGRTDDPEYAWQREFEVLIEISSLYRDTAGLLDRVTSEENIFKANRYYKDLENYKPLTVG